jgi:hypothetical protein
MTIAMVCRIWAERDGCEALAAVRAIEQLRELQDATAKAVGRRLRTFLVQVYKHNTAYTYCT